MSKNIYRVNKKSDLDEIMKNHFYKPVCIIFVSKSTDTKLYTDITSTLVTFSKQLTYLMMVLIDFDDFIDNNNFFQDIKSNVPFFLAFFKGKNIMSEQDKENFIPLMINHMDQIHKSYLNRLVQAFNQNQENTSQLEQSGQSNITEPVQQENTLQSNQKIQNNNQVNEVTQNVDDVQNEEIQSFSSDTSSVSSKSSASSKSSKTSKSSNSSEKVSKSSNESSKPSKKDKKTKKVKKVVEESESSDKDNSSNDTEKIQKEKAKLKKIKELQKLKELLKN